MDKTLAQQIGKRLKMLRVEKELNQTQLADILRVTKSNVSKYEKGDVEVNFETLAKISEYFDVSLDYLFGYTDFKKPDDPGLDITYITVTKEVAEKGMSPEDIKRAIDFYMSMCEKFDEMKKEEKENKSDK